MRRCFSSAAACCSRAMHSPRVAERSSMRSPRRMHTRIPAMTDADKPVRRFDPGSASFRWEDVPLLDYRSESTAPFRDITRQTLFGRADMRGELRYFEIAAGGHSTLERHEHTHAVMIL